MGDKGLIPPGLAYLADNINSKHNLLGAGKGAGSKWAKDLNLQKEAGTVFFAGCGYQYSSELESLMSLSRRMDKGGISEMGMNLAGVTKKFGIDAAGIYRKVMAKSSDDDSGVLRDAVKVLRKMGIEPGYLAEDEPCCGGILYYMGLQADFKRHALSVHSQLKTHNVSKIIGIVPSCTYTLRNLISKAVNDADLEVKHFSQVVAENLNSLSLRYPKQAKVTYHDPCQLVRYLEIVEEPRRILGAIQGLELIEPTATNHEWATCCGGGGGFEAVFPEMSQILAENRAKELVETDAEIIVTHCPGCIMQIKTGLKSVLGDKAQLIEVLDLAQVISKAIGN